MTAVRAFAEMGDTARHVSRLMCFGRLALGWALYTAALQDLDRVIALDSGNAAARYVRGQVLVRMGCDKEGREELARATKMLNEQRAARHRELEGETVPSPEVARGQSRD